MKCPHCGNPNVPDKHITYVKEIDGKIMQLCGNRGCVIREVKNYGDGYEPVRAEENPVKLVSASEITKPTKPKGLKSPNA